MAENAFIFKFSLNVNPSISPLRVAIYETTVFPIVEFDPRSLVAFILDHARRLHSLCDYARWPRHDQQAFNEIAKHPSLVEEPLDAKTVEFVGTFIYPKTCRNEFPALVIWSAHARGQSSDGRVRQNASHVLY